MLNNWIIAVMNCNELQFITMQWIGAIELTDQVSQSNYQYDNFVLLIQLKFSVLQPFHFFHVSVTLGALLTHFSPVSHFYKKWVNVSHKMAPAISQTMTLTLTLQSLGFA